MAFFHKVITETTMPEVKTDQEMLDAVVEFVDGQLEKQRVDDLRRRLSDPYLTFDNEEALIKFFAKK